MEHLSKSKQVAEHGDSDSVITAVQLLRSTQGLSSVVNPSQVSPLHCLSLVCVPGPQELEHDDQLCHSLISKKVYVNCYISNSTIYAIKNGTGQEKSSQMENRVWI